MRYLGTALIAEGATDDRLLPRLVGRALDDLCASQFDDVVEIPDVVTLRATPGPPSIPQILQLVERNAGWFSLIFVHRDQGANRVRLEREWLNPLSAKWSGRAERLVMVVPIRETEAWALADGEALRRAMGVRWSDRALGVPGRPRDVEKIADPKRPLTLLGERIGRPVEDYFERLSEFIRLDVLRTVPSFATWQADTLRALTELGLRYRS